MVEESLERKLAKSRKTVRFNPPISIQGSWILGLTILEIYNSIFIINTTYNKLELYTLIFDELSFTELKDELEEILEFLNIISEHLQDEIIGPRIISTYKELETEKTHTEGYYKLLMGYARSLFRNFESYLRMVIGFEEGDILLISKQYNSNFVTYEISPGFYTFKDIS